MEKLRVNSFVSVNVNDEGGVIHINVADQSFVKHLLNLIQEFYDRAPEFAQKEKEIDALPEESTDDTLQKLLKKTEYNEQIHREFGDRINTLFGDDVTTKVFGGGVPSVPAWTEFFMLLAPIIQKYKQKKSEQFAKYSPDRNKNV